MYLFGVSDQPLGFRLVSLVDVDWSTVRPKLYRVVDGLLPRQEADAVVLNAGGGQFIAILSAGDTSGNYLSFQLEAPNCIPDEATILPFDGASLPFSVNVQDWPIVHTFPGVRTLQFDFDSGLEATQPYAQTARISLQDASPLQRGAVNLAAQSYAGVKEFRDGAAFWTGGFGFPGVSLRNNGFADAQLSWDGTELLLLAGGLGFLPRTEAVVNPADGSPGNFYLRAYDVLGNQIDALYGAVDSFDVRHNGVWGNLTDGTPVAGGLVVGIGTGGMLPWTSITGTPTTLAGYGVTSPLDVPEGGTGAVTLDLYGTLSGGGTGPVISTLPGTAGYVWTSNGPSAYPTWQAGGGGGGMAIGAPVASGTAGSVLFLDGSVNLAQSSGIQYGPYLTVTDGTAVIRFTDGLDALSITGSSASATLATGGGTGGVFANGSNFGQIGTVGSAAGFGDGTHSVILCDTVNAVNAAIGSIKTQGSSGNTYSWQSAPGTPLDPVTPVAWLLVNVVGLGDGFVPFHQ